MPVWQGVVDDVQLGQLWGAGDVGTVLDLVVVVPFCGVAGVASVLDLSGGDQDSGFLLRILHGDDDGVRVPCLLHGIYDGAQVAVFLHFAS